MMIYSVLQIVLCLAVSILGAWTDIKTGRVRNSYLLIAAGAGIGINIAYIIVQGIDSMNLSRWAINFGFSIVLSVVFYLSDVWAPGDAKLYMLVTALYPMGFYAAHTDNLFPALSIVIFAYATGYIYLVIVALRKGKDGTRKLQLPTPDRAFFSGFLINAGLIIGFQLLPATLLPNFFEGNRVLILLCLVGLCYILQRNWPTVLTTLGLIGLVITVVTTIISKDYSTLLLSLPSSMIVALLTQLLIQVADSNSYREITGDELKPGMILSLGSVIAMQKCIDPNIPHQTTENRRSRLSASQTEAVRNWCRITNRPITIVEMLPFAPFICIGLITELIRNYLFY